MGGDEEGAMHLNFRKTHESSVEMDTSKKDEKTGAMS